MLRLTRLAQRLQRALHDHQRPLLVEELLGGERVVGGGEVELHVHHAPAALLGLGAIALVGHEVLQRAEEEGAELAAARIDLVQAAMLEHPCEKRLGEVLSVGTIDAAAPHVREHRRPVARAEVVQRVGRCAGGEDQRPVGGLESRGGHGSSVGDDELSALRSQLSGRRPS